MPREGGQESRVKVKGIMSSVSSTPVTPGKTYPLSLLDHAMRLHHIRAVFYYRSDPAEQSCPVERERLKDSLTETLSFYAAMTGRLRLQENGNWEVKCTDAGVRVVETSVGCSMEEWLRTVTPEEEKDLTYWLEMPEDPSIWSPYYVQINEFEGGGIAIGLSCTHMHADPTCATLFVKSWSDVHRGGSITHPPFFHPPGLRGRPSPNTDTNSARYYETKSKAEARSPSLHVKMSTATFRFSDETVKKLLREIHPDCSEATAFDALAALFWDCASRAKGLAPSNTRSVAIVFDLRKLLHAPLPHGFYGNALHFSNVVTDGFETEEKGFGHAAGIIHRHLSGLEEEEYWSAIDWLESQKDADGKFATLFGMYGPELTVLNMEHVLAYEAIFDKGVKPVLVSYHIGNVYGEGLIMVLPSPEEGIGKTVTVTLPSQELKKLVEDDKILPLESHLLFVDKY
ncbi:hydroxycinnamoyltransferase-like [Aristolochia californica]|uniref:hydroxycinnamoyltransferase-like n=1 Tax=Aristolochia californica TaxID=171875 RepID=UPI0035E0B31C